MTQDSIANEQAANTETKKNIYNQDTRISGEKEKQTTEDTLDDINTAFMAGLSSKKSTDQARLRMLKARSGY